MNLRIKKKRRKSRLKKILDHISIYSSILNIEYSYYYKPQDFVSFTIKGWEDWKFAVQLIDDSFWIFGQGIAAIDKFKIDRSIIREQSVQAFLLELVHYKSGIVTEYNDYQDVLEYHQKKLVETKVYDQLVLDTVLEAIHVFNSEHDNIMLKLVDRNTNISPRYKIDSYFSEMSDDEALRLDCEAFSYLCNALNVIDYKRGGESFLYWNLSDFLTSKDEYLEKYSPNSLSYDEYLKSLYDENKDTK